MTRAEFETRAGASISAEDYKVIEYVYQFHPSISEVGGKDEIATLWKVGGMRVISDMLETSREAERIEQEIRNKRAELKALEEQYAELKM